MGHPLQIIRVKKVTGNLNVLWLINAFYSKMLAIIGPVYRELVGFGVDDATFSFLLLSLYFECVHSVVDIPFSGEKLP